MKSEVIQRIIKKIRNRTLRDKLIQKVQNDQDLTLPESHMLYDDVEFGKELQMTKKRPVDIDWTDHAEYRGELRDINPDSMNEDVKEKLKTRFLKNPKSKGKEKFKSPSGTAVVDFNVSRIPADADIVTTWAFDSENAALQCLANITGKRIKIANIDEDIAKRFDGDIDPELEDVNDVFWDLEVESKNISADEVNIMSEKEWNSGVSKQQYNNILTIIQKHRKDRKEGNPKSPFGFNASNKYLSLYSNKDDLRRAFDAVEGEGFFDESMSQTNPESLNFAFLNIEEAKENAKLYDIDSGDIYTTVYGYGGGNRYLIGNDGSIKFSKMHGRNSINKAKEAGFEIM